MAWAQKSAPDPYSAEPLVLQRVDVVYAMNADGTGYMQKTVVAKVQSQTGVQQLGIIRMGFAANSQHVEFHYVRTRRPDGSVTETPVSGVMEQPLPATVQAPFYSDLKVAELPVKNLQAGDTVEWEARLVMTRPEAPNEFWDTETVVTEGAVVLEQSVELRAPAMKNVTVWTNPALGIKVKESTDGDLKVYRWETKQLKPTVGPEAEAAKEAKKKHVETAAEELDSERGKLPSVAWTTFPSWAAVGEWYRGLELSRVTPDDEIKAKVAELTAGKTTDEDKVRAIYEYVATQVRYIGVAFGVGRYQPHQAVDVLHNQYGDCKDKATLLTAMLAAAGVPSDAALIGAGIRFNDAVPSPAAFNHLITHLKLNGQDVWLDSTEEVAPYQMMYGVLRDREALVVPATGSPTIEKTPKDPPFASFQKWTAKGTLDANGISESQITLEARGDEELLLRGAAREVGPAQYDELMQKLLAALGYAGAESNPDFSRPDDVEQPFRMSFNYHREKAGDWDDLKIIPQLAPVPLPYVDEKDPPKGALDLGTPRTETSTAEMKLPAGWSAELPEAVHEKSAYATYDLSYRLDRGTLYSERKVVVLENKIPVTDWKTYKKFADAVGVGTENYVQLRRAGGEKPAVTSASSSSGSGNTQLQAIYSQLETAYQYGEVSKMEGLLKQMKDINPRAPRLMAWEASVAILHHQYQEAIEDNRKELALYPDEYDRYGAIAWIQMQQKDRAGAEDTLRDWAKSDASNPQPLMQLSGLLAQDGKGAESVQAAKDAVARAPEGNDKHEQTLLLLGSAQMKADMKDDATATLRGLLQKTDSPEMMNDAAYTLADAGKELALDEEKERVAIDRLTEETKSWTLDESPAVLKQKTQMLLASWDTMAWILYKEGKPKEALSYAEAARMGRPDPLVTEHVLKVRSALAQLDAKSAADPDAGKSEQQLRTVPLGPSGGLRGVAEYRLLLAHGQIERAELTGDDKLDGSEALLKRARLPQFFPAGSDAKLVRQGMLNCVAGQCQLVLEP
ncbi:MAG TPA: DUF3857 domain-containing protein [Acidobacteriaceae bacterium]|nr:DUF3857 domain-containing protein [Acidobacteriaceae bacterium]